jgi:membrane-associated protease RseP (regulator of RpoE activity)
MSDPTSPISSLPEFERPIEVVVVHPYRPRYWLHLILLIATFFTMLVVGSRMQFNFLHGLPVFTTGDESVPFFPIGWALAAPARLWLGVPFAMALIFILLAHEMGHYVYCRRYRVTATLPFFIPAPTLIGTLGAVIRIKSPIRSRAALFDIGIAGPIAGFIAALGTLVISLTLSLPLAAGTPPAEMNLGYPLIFRLAHNWMAPLIPAIAGVPLGLVNLHPVAVAAWVGMFATTINLIPSGQLDGGHLVYALWPRAHRYVSWLVVVVLAYMGWHYAGWRLWASLVTAMNIMSWRQRQAPDYPPLPASRWPLALLGLTMLLLTFTVIPFSGPGLRWR